MAEKHSPASNLPSQSIPRLDRNTLIAFIIFIFLGGGASVAIRFSYGELAPFWGATLRFASAALIFWLLVLGQRISLPRGRALAGAALFGVLSVGASFIFIYWGLVKTPASLYQTTVAVVPLLTLFFAAAHKLERIQLRGVFGALLAMAGIALAFSSSLLSGIEVSLPHMLAILLGAACLAEAGVIAKLIPRSHPLVTNAVAMTVGAVMLAAASLISGEAWVLPSGAVTWLVMVYLSVGASVGAFMLYLYILARWTASGTSYAFVLFPIVTVILATLLVGERITWVFVIGGVLVLLGVWVGALRPVKQSPTPAASAAVSPAAAEITGD